MTVYKSKCNVKVCRRALASIKVTDRVLALLKNKKISLSSYIHYRVMTRQGHKNAYANVERETNLEILRNKYLYSSRFNKLDKIKELL